MPELRKDYLTDEYVIVATERSKRPEQFQEEHDLPSKKATCPFCPENEHLLPGVLDEIKGDTGWAARVAPNKYTIVEPTGDPLIKTDNTFFTYASAYGFHEVIIESPHHDEELEQQDPSRIAAVLQLAASRMNVHKNEDNIHAVVLFKNRGRTAGASISHGHLQLVACNLMPPFIKNQLEAFYDYFIKKESCPYCEIMHVEKGSYRRVFENEHIIAFTPYASRFPFEVWIFPKRHISSMTQLAEKEYLALADVLKNLLLRLDTMNNPPYNLQFLSANLTEPYHFHVRIIPRLTSWAGFEFGADAIVNPVSPETAAAFYRA